MNQTWNDVELNVCIPALYIVVNLFLRKEFVFSQRSMLNTTYSIYTYSIHLYTKLRAKACPKPPLPHMGGATLGEGWSSAEKLCGIQRLNIVDIMSAYLILHS